MTRLSPTNKIESFRDPKMERVYVKFPGDEIRDITATSATYYSETDITLVPNYLDKLKTKHARYMHNHPTYLVPFTNLPFSGSSYPSGGDLTTFLSRDHIKSLVIAETNPRNGEVRKYCLIRKTRKTPERTCLNFFQASIMDIANFFLIGKKGLEYYSHKYNLQNRVINVKKD